MPRHGRTQTMETIQAPPVEAEDHQRPHTTQSKLRLMRCGVCGLTLVEGHPLNGGKETVWRLDESDYGPEGSHPVIQGELDI